MTMSDVLQLDCSIDNEIARNATKNFAEMLGKTFEQYKKLWNEYLKLRKYCEDANFKIPFQLFQSDCYSNIDTSNTDVNTSSQKYGCSTESSDISQVLGTSIPVVLDESVSYDDKFDNKQTNQKNLPSSPILIKDCFRYRKNNNISSHSSSNDSNENIVQHYLPIKENLFVSTSSSQKSELSIEPKDDEPSLFSIHENNDEVQCTPMANIPRKLGVSKLYNVGTTLLKNGKKIKQSKFVFLPPEQSADNRLYLSKSHLLSSPKRINQDQNKSIDEEIIQVSPNKHAELNLRTKNLKVKRKTAIKITRNNNAKFPLKESGQLTLNQNSLSTCTSEQKSQLSPIRKFKTFSFSNNEKIKTNRDIRSSLSPVDTVEQMHYVDDKNLLTVIKKNEELDSVKDNNQTKERSNSQLSDQKHQNNSSYENDETFCLIGEKLKEFKDDRLPKSSPVRRSLMSSFDVPCKRKNVEIDQPSKKKSDRAKMAGVTCWECKKYYANLGLSEEEIKARQNQCSRHRTNEKKRGDTPEGFWNPLFSGTYTSTLQDD